MIWNDEAQLWIPDDSVKMDRCWRFITRNTGDLDKGIAWTRKFNRAIQAGGHVGIFPNYLAAKFKNVVTFESDPDLYSCLVRNVKANVVTCDAALSSGSGKARFRRSLSGTGQIADDGDLEVQTTSIDGSGCLKADFIHLDVEGHEVEVLRGAERLIARCSPTIQLEILPRFKDQIYEYMESIGYRVVCDTCRDHVFTRGGK